MGSEVYQAQVLRAFFDTITGTDRNLTRIYMCVISLAKLRMEPPEKIRFLSEQMQASKAKHELSIDILDYMTSVANMLDTSAGESPFNITAIKSDSIGSLSLDTL